MFHTLTIGPEQENLKFQHGSKNSAFNVTKRIFSDEDKDVLIKEVDRPDKDLMEIAFQKHCRVLHYRENSGLNPYCILSVQFFIDRFSPTLFDQSESDNESLA